LLFYGGLDTGIDLGNLQTPALPEVVTKGGSPGLKRPKLIDRQVSIFAQTKPPPTSILGDTVTDEDGKESLKPHSELMQRKHVSEFFERVKSNVHVAQ